MNTTIRHQALRRSVTLLGALVLVSSALMASSAAAFAKDPPTANVNSKDCDTQFINSEFYRTVYDATLWLDHNKGRWLFVKAVVEFDAGGILVTNHPAPTKVDKNVPFIVEAKDDVSASQGADLVLTFTNKKGAEAGSQTIRICNA